MRRQRLPELRPQLRLINAARHHTRRQNFPTASAIRRKHDRLPHTRQRSTASSVTTNFGDRSNSTATKSPLPTPAARNLLRPRIHLSVAPFLPLAPDRDRVRGSNDPIGKRRLHPLNL